MAQMTLAGLNYGAPMATKSTGLGRGFYTPQQAKVERSAQYQNLDAMALENLSKPKANRIQPLQQPVDINNSGTNVFSSPDMLNNFNSMLRENVSYVSNVDPRLDSRGKMDVINRAKMDVYNRILTEGGPLGGTEYGKLKNDQANEFRKRRGLGNIYGSIPKAGQALSEPYKPTKVTGASNSSFDFSNFGNALKAIKEEQASYKRFSDPNFKLLSEEEMSKLADERFNKEWANRTWQDLYTPIDPAKHNKAREKLLADVKAGKQSKTALGMFDRYQTNNEQMGSANDLFSRSKSGARAGYLSELRQDNATKQFFDSEAGKKRIEAGKKLIDFYGTQTGLADSTFHLYGKQEDIYDDRTIGAAFTFQDIPGSAGTQKVTTEYQKKYVDAINKLKEERREKKIPSGLSKEDHIKIRDMIAGDFNKSVGLTGEFVPFGYNKLNVDAAAKSYYEGNPKNTLTGVPLEENARQKEFLRRTLNIAPVRARWDSIWGEGGYRDTKRNPGAVRPAWSIYR